MTPEQLMVVAELADQPNDALAEMLSVSPRTIIRARRKLNLPDKRTDRPFTHGASAYARSRCRCAICREGNRVRANDYLKRRRASS